MPAKKSKPVKAHQNAYSGLSCSLCDEPAQTLISGSLFCRSHRNEILASAKEIKERKQKEAEFKAGIPQTQPKNAPEGLYG